jgi:hypothetical protein
MVRTAAGVVQQLQCSARTQSCYQLIARFASPASVVVAGSPTYPKHIAFTWVDGVDAMA